MYVQERNGKFRFFETYIDPKTRMRKTACVTLDRNTSMSRKRAQNLLADRIRELTDETEKSSVMTVTDLIEAYTAFQRTHVAPQTLVGDKNALKAVSRILGPKTDINQVDARFITKRLDMTDEDSTRKNYRIKHIKKMFRWAYQYDYLRDGSWISKLKKYKDSEKQRRSGKYLEANELRILLDSLNVEKYRLFVEFLALTGMRVGEALALTWDDIDTENKTIKIDKTLSLVTGEVGPTKTEESTRVIHIQEELLPVIEKIPPQVFSDIQYHAFNKYLKENTLRTIGRPLSPHSLRHTHVSLLAGSGVPLDVISHRCGHSDSDVTREIYLHVTQKMKDRDAEAVDQIRLLDSTNSLPSDEKTPILP